VVLSDQERHADDVSLLRATEETAGQAAQLRRLAANVRLASATLRQTVNSRRGAGPVIDVRRMRAALTGARERADHLERALVSNRRIGMAVGILMVTRRLSDDAAFDCLRQESQRRNIKLRDLAEQVIYTGEL
jgi:AmiR/NasT family two-component response regulator